LFNRLTYSALVGMRRQSVKDAERLLSFATASSLKKHGHLKEAEYVDLIARWHEASDGRGLSQLQRCRQNYSLLTYLLVGWCPWYQETGDLSLVDINRYS
jgi:hypothetical protein